MGTNMVDVFMKTKCNCPDCTFPECDCWNVKPKCTNCNNWEEIAGYIKGLINDHDHVGASPYKLISDINNVLDDAFGDMDKIMNEINNEKVCK